MKRLSLLTSLITFYFAALIFISPMTVKAAEEFLDLQCITDVKSSDLCNVSFYGRFMKINFVRTGRSVKIDYDRIVNWNYSDSSLRKRDWGLASRIGILGLLFTKVEHKHVFTIVFKDEFDDRGVVLLDFDDKQYVLPMKAALSESAEIN